MTQKISKNKQNESTYPPPHRQTGRGPLKAPPRNNTFDTNTEGRRFRRVASGRLA